MSREKPFIGLNADYLPQKKQAPPYIVLQTGYADAVVAAGGIPVVVPQAAGEREDLSRVLDRLDGFVLTGCARDLDPRRDGFMLLRREEELMPEHRETFDRTLMHLIAVRRMAVFGIGAGMQLLNVSQGGTLSYNIPEDFPGAIPHRDPTDPSHRHSLTVVPGSLMERVFGEGEIRVNSMHHMAVDDVAPGFTVTARCPDGIVEAIESEMSDWFAIGTQFHPEAPSASALDMRIFEEFIDAVRDGVAEVAQLPMKRTRR